MGLLYTSRKGRAPAFLVSALRRGHLVIRLEEGRQFGLRDGRSLIVDRKDADFVLPRSEDSDVSVLGTVLNRIIDQVFGYPFEWFHTPVTLKDQVA